MLGPPCNPPVKVAHLLEKWVDSIVPVDFQKTFVPHCGSHAAACRSLLGVTSMSLAWRVTIISSSLSIGGIQQSKDRGGGRKKTIVFEMVAL